MTADEAAFLARIREEPDADLPRLVFADWLDERGDEARARFLRAHVELARLAHDSPRRRELAWECRQYIEGESTADIPEPFEFARPRFGRGLIEYAAFWEESADGIATAFRLAPLRRVWVWGLDVWMSTIKAIPTDNVLRTLDLTGNELEGRSLVFLWQDMPFPHLKELILAGCELGDDDADELCSFPRWRNLERIHLGANPFTESGRERLRNHFGERVTFECDGDPDRLYAFDHEDDRFTVGFGRDRTQHLVTVGFTGARIAEFDHAGNVLRLEGRTHPETRDEEPLRAALLDELGHSPATIRVKRFQFPDGCGITPLSPNWMRVLDDPASDERDTARSWLDRWLDNGKFRWQ